MAKLINFLLLSSVLFFVGCSGSDVYRGDWKATDSNGDKFDIHFESKSFSVKDSTGKSTKFEYKQHSISINNGVKSYGIRLSDGRAYTILFPLSGDVSKGVILSGNQPVYAICRDAYIQFSDLYKLQ